MRKPLKPVKTARKKTTKEPATTVSNETSEATEAEVKPRLAEGEVALVEFTMLKNGTIRHNCFAKNYAMLGALIAQVHDPRMAQTVMETVQGQTPPDGYAMALRAFQSVFRGNKPVIEPTDVIGLGMDIIQ